MIRLDMSVSFVFSNSGKRWYWGVELWSEGWGQYSFVSRETFRTKKEALSAGRKARGLLKEVLRSTED